MVRTLLTALFTRDLPVAAVVFVVVFLITLLLPKIVRGEEQKFVVVNKVPQFTVTNKVATPTLPTDPNQPAPAGYKWIKRGDGPWKLERDVPGVAVPKGNTFPGKPSAGGYNGSHRCTNCGHQSAPGTGTWIVRGTNRDGTHSHACPVCNDHWRH